MSLSVILSPLPLFFFFIHLNSMYSDKLFYIHPLILWNISNSLDIFCCAWDDDDGFRRTSRCVLSCTATPSPLPLQPQCLAFVLICGPVGLVIVVGSYLYHLTTPSESR